MPSKHKRIILIGSGVFGFFLFLFSCISYLKTPQGLEFIFKHVRKFLVQNFHLQFDFTRSEIHPFSSIYFENLHIIQNLDTTQTEINVKKLKLDYSFSIFSRSFVVEKAIVDQPQIQFTSQTPPSSSSNTVADTSVLAFFRSDLKIWIKDLQLTGFQAHLKTPTLTLESVFPKLDLKITFRNLTDQLLTTAELKTGEGSLQATALDKNQETKIQGVSNVSLQTKASLSYHSRQWTYEISPSTLGLTFHPLTVITKTPTHTYQVQASKIQSQSELALSAQSTELSFSVKSGSIENLLKKLTTRNTLSTGPLRIQQTPQKTKDLRLNPQTFSLNADLEESKLKLDLDIPQLEIPNIKKLWHIHAQSGIQLSNPLEIDALFQVQEQKVLQLHSQISLPNNTRPSANWLINANFEVWIGDYLQGLLTKSDLTKLGSWSFPTQLKLKFLRERGEEPAFEAHVSTEAKQTSPSPLPHSFLSGLTAQTDLSWQWPHVSLSELIVKLHGTTFKLTAEASGNPARMNFQTQGTFDVDFNSVQLGKYFREAEGQSLHGKLQMPWSLGFYQGKDISLKGDLQILHLDWEKIGTKKSPSNLRILSVKGRIPLSEELEWKSSQLSFSHFIQQNAFERVDFERLQPMISESEKVYIQELKFEDKIFGPFQGYFSIRQNLLYAHQFELKLGSGRTYGEIFLNTRANNLQLGMLSRLSDLKLGEILPGKYLKSNSLEEDKMNGRSGLVVNLNTGNIDGRVDFTQLSGRQLTTLINVADPKYENENMNRARFALDIAAPSMIQMSFQKGYMDLGFRIGGAIGKDFSLRGIPVTPWISEASAKVVKLTQQGLSK